MNLTDFGWSGGNTAAQNTTAFNDFMAACPDGDGAHGVFPCGAFECNSLVVTKSGIRLSGQGVATHLINATTNAPCIKIKGASRRYHCTVENLRFGQKADVTPVAGNCAILIDDADDCRLHDIITIPYPAALHNGIVLVVSTNTVLRNLYVASCLNDGYHFSGASEIIGGDLASMSNGGSGFVFNGVSGVYADHLNAFGNAGSAFKFPAGETNQYVLGNGWVGDTSGSYNWAITDLNTSTFSDCWGATQLSTAANTWATGLILTSSTCFDIGFSNSQFLNNNSHGVIVYDSAHDIRFDNCLFGGKTGNGNGKSGAGCGFYIGLATHVSVHGCRSRGNASNGIKTAVAASNYLSFIGNNFTGNTGAATSYGHTGSNVAIGLNL